MFNETKGVKISLIFLILAVLLGCNINSVAAQINVTGYNDFFAASLGFYYVAGEVQNLGVTPLKSVSLNIEFQLNSSQGTFSATAITTLPTILAGRRSPFAYWLTNRTLAAQVQSVSVSIENYATETETVPTNLTIIGHQSTENSILGFFRNDGDMHAIGAAVYATFYDSNKKPLAVVMGDGQSLDSGESAYFNITVPFPENLKDVKYYSLTAHSANPHYTVKEEVILASFGDEDGGFPQIITVFIIVITFSFLVLIGAFVIAKIKTRKRRNSRKKQPTRLHFTDVTAKIHLKATPTGNKSLLLDIDS